MNGTQSTKVWERRSSRVTRKVCKGKIRFPGMKNTFLQFGETANKKVYYYYYYYYYCYYFSGPRGLVILIRANPSHILGLVKINQLSKTSFFFHFKLTVHQRRERPTETERRRGEKIKEIMTRENSNTIVSHHLRDKQREQ